MFNYLKEIALVDIITPSYKPGEIGKKLRQQREQNNISFGDAEAQTGIQRRYLEALEDGEWDLFYGGPSIGRRLAKSYAEQLGLDPIETIFGDKGAFNSQFYGLLGLAGLIFAIFVSSAFILISPIEQPPIPSATPTPLLTPTVAISLPTLTPPTPTPTHTPTLSPTPLPPTATPTLTPTYTPTPTPSPTPRPVCDMGEGKMALIPPVGEEVAVKENRTGRRQEPGGEIIRPNPDNQDFIPYLKPPNRVTIIDEPSLVEGQVWVKIIWGGKDSGDGIQGWVECQQLDLKEK